ncbi:MAG: porin [Gammaproteobacteria bacterium]|nr:MAG: porin [Gammaproteobacteria bacterium]
MVCVLAAAFTAVAVAQAQTAAPAPKAPDNSLTWNGITLYGIVDVGVQYQTHGVPASDYFPAGTEAIVLGNSNGSITAVTPSNLSQSRIGLSGTEPLTGDWSAVFRLETFFNPQSGNLSDALKSQVLNNGKAPTAQSTNVDSSVAGQLFAGAAYAGFSSPTVGTFTFGRHVTLLADGVGKYDPMSASQAFSLIGFSGTTAGGGDTEDRRLDQSVKYSGKYGPLHLGALYQFSGASGSANTAVQLQIGGDFAGGSVDAYYAKKKDAIATAPLSAVQAGDLATICATSVTPPVNPSGAQCYSISNSLAATISDNTTYGVMGSYSVGTLKFSAGYEHIAFDNPDTPLPRGSLTIGGYVLAFVTINAFNNQKTLQVFWAGVKIAATPDLDLLGAYYGYKQNSYATGADTGCSSDTVSAKCSGTENAFSLVADYRFSKRFDGYLGTFYTGVQDGLAFHFLNKSTLTTTTGIRFKF